MLLIYFAPPQLTLPCLTLRPTLPCHHPPHTMLPHIASPLVFEVPLLCSNAFGDSLPANFFMATPLQGARFDMPKTLRQENGRNFSRTFFPSFVFGDCGGAGGCLGLGLFLGGIFCCCCFCCCLGALCCLALPCFALLCVALRCCDLPCLFCFVLVCLPCFPCCAVLCYA